MLDFVFGSFNLFPVGPTDFEDWLALALKLWPEEAEDDIQEMRDTLTEILQSPREAGFLVRDR